MPLHPAERLIMHVDMDAFFAAVEEREDPSLKGKPGGITASTHAEGFDLDERAVPLGAKLLAQLAESALK